MNATYTTEILLTIVRRLPKTNYNNRQRCNFQTWKSFNIKGHLLQGRSTIQSFIVKVERGFSGNDGGYNVSTN